MGLNAVIYEGEKEDRELASKHLGNVAQIALLRDFATGALGAQSLVVAKILYDGTHSGDSLALSDLWPLKSELQVLERTSDENAQTFARDMLALVDSALTHERPIHFS